jgi:hypothetical protein
VSQLDQEITVCQVTVRRPGEMIAMISEDLQMRCEGTISSRVAKSNGSASGQRVERVRDYKLTRPETGAGRAQSIFGKFGNACTG